MSICVSAAWLRLSKVKTEVAFCPGIELSPLMYSAIPELIALSSFLERASFSERCWVAETMEG